MVSWSTLTMNCIDDPAYLVEAIDTVKPAKYFELETGIVYMQFGDTDFFEDISILEAGRPMWNEATIVRASTTSQSGVGWYLKVNKFTDEIEDCFVHMESRSGDATPRGRAARDALQNYSDMPAKVAIGQP